VTGPRLVPFPSPTCSPTSDKPHITHISWSRRPAVARNAANRPTAHTSPDAHPHTPPDRPRRRTRALPLIGIGWCAVAAAHLHAIYILRRLYPYIYILLRLVGGR